MLIIVNDDPTYVSWISRHHHGFVIDSKRKPTKNHLVLHRATCPAIKPHKRAHLTIGAHIKICSLDATELAAWAQEETGGPLVICQNCRPDLDESATGEHHDHAVTKLGSNILSYVVDLAVIYLDGEGTDFRPTIHTVAEYLGKTPAQIMTAVQRVIEAGLVISDDTSLSDKSILYPTAEALRSIPAFGAMTDKELQDELGRLRTS